MTEFPPVIYRRYGGGSDQLANIAIWSGDGVWVGCGWVGAIIVS